MVTMTSIPSYPRRAAASKASAARSGKTEAVDSATCTSATGATWPTAPPSSLPPYFPSPRPRCPCAASGGNPARPAYADRGCGRLRPPLASGPRRLPFPLHRSSGSLCVVLAPRRGALEATAFPRRSSLVPGSSLLSPGVAAPRRLAHWLSVAAGTVPVMGKSAAPAALYQCSECGWQTTKWAGRCGGCQEWGTVAEVRVPARERLIGQARNAAARIADVDVAAARARPTGLGELDRVLGGGLVPGAVVLLAGEPGVGKSTLLLEAGALVSQTGPVLYVTGEESAAQVRLRADRIGAVGDNLYIAAETELSAVLAQVEAVRPVLLIVDSVQTIVAPGIDGTPGGVTQIREVTAALMAVAKQRSLSTVLVGHVTKEGAIAGPRALEHLVDVMLHFEGDRHAQLRMVRALKNRFGPTDEVGCFELGESGLAGLADPSGLFISHNGEHVPGTCLTVTLEGRRPLIAEVQTLLVPSPGTEVPPRRVTAGLDSARVAMVIAVLQRRAAVSMGRQDVFAATIGGVRLTEP